MKRNEKHCRLQWWLDYLLYPLLLAIATGLLLLYTFVIPHGAQAVQPAANADYSLSGGTYTDTGYQDATCTVQFATYRAYDSDIYLADIQLKNAESLKSGFAGDSFGRNITETTSAIANRCKAIVAVNGDFYGAHDTGFVLRNGVLYRENQTDSTNPDYMDLTIDANGNLGFIVESQTDPRQLVADGVVQAYSFGPALLNNGAMAIASEGQVSRVDGKNPRTILGQIEPLHYVMLVADGRTEQSAGLSLEEACAFLQEYGVKTAYNLDGGGSATMVFHGKVVNHPTHDGVVFEERGVSDIVYIG
ncbi:MAG: phosphodiester glycosidase family protein [Pygmaiobacter sp.]|nr:phosphodiester glycosidase family protein [Pygmaiobacter sp.]